MILPIQTDKPRFPPKRPLPPDAGELCSIDSGFLAGEGDIELDLGCARGHFLIAAAAAEPGVRFLGIDFQLSRIRETRRKISRLGLGNAAAVRGEILETIIRYVPHGSVRRIHLLFPDPWPKRRHAPRRVLQGPALDIFRALLRPGGELRFLTDDEPYFRQALMLLESSTHWTLQSGDPHGEWPPTEFQARFQRMGLPVHGFVAQIADRHSP
jgi:tRNA (guanine-N7-)-methyltransferase